jgi:hypothetical protein
LMVGSLPYGVYTDAVEAESMHGSVDELAFRVGLRAIRVGIAAGFFACLAYSLAAFAHLPKLATTTLVACFGPALGVASYGLRRLLDFETPRLSSALGLLLNALAGALFSAMALVQLAVGYSAGGDKVAASFIAIWLGLDVAWGAYVGLGTICFALAMLRHPRFGRIFAFFGMAIGAGLLALHLYTFPTPPQNAGLVDLGPALGLWYLVVTIQMWPRQRVARWGGPQERLS